MPSLTLTPIQAAVMDLAGQERARRMELLQRQAVEAETLLRNAIHLVAKEHGVEPPARDVNVNADRGADGQLATLAWADPAPVPDAPSVEAPNAEGAPILKFPGTPQDQN